MMIIVIIIYINHIVYRLFSIRLLAIRRISSVSAGASNTEIKENKEQQYLRRAYGIVC